MTTAANHFGHRTGGGIVVDLFWEHDGLADVFRVEVEDRREGGRFVIHPTTGVEALHAFHHPYAVATAVSREDLPDRRVRGRRTR